MAAGWRLPNGEITKYFVEENEETWRVNARAGVTSKKIEAWFENAVEKYNVTVDTKAPETTAEAVTA